jgi:hypothetical protein
VAVAVRLVTLLADALAAALADAAGEPAGVLLVFLLDDPHAVATMMIPTTAALIMPTRNDIVCSSSGLAESGAYPAAHSPAPVAGEFRPGRKPVPAVQARAPYARAVDSVDRVASLGPTRAYSADTEEAASRLAGSLCVVTGAR